MTCLGGECAEPRANDRYFCVSCCKILDRVGREINFRHVPRFTNEKARVAWVAERDAPPKAAAPPPPTTCRAIGCTRAARAAESTCYRDRGLPEHSNVRTNVCSYEGCERTARWAGGLCREHALAVAA